MQIITKSPNAAAIWLTPKEVRALQAALERLSKTGDGVPLEVRGTDGLLELYWWRGEPRRITDGNIGIVKE
jgi:hypothetical protein